MAELRQHCWASEAECGHSQPGAPTVLETEICLLHVTVRLVAELLHTAVSPTMLSGGMAGLMTCEVGTNVEGQEWAG